MARSIAQKTASQQWDIVRAFSRLSDAEKVSVLDLVDEAPPLSPAVRSGVSSVARSARKAA